MNSAIEAEFFAKEADRLLADQTLTEALRKMREAATEALIRANAENIHDVIRLQAKITVIDEFKSELQTMVGTLALRNRPSVMG